MSKKKKIIIAIAVVVAIILAIVGARTYAKYMSDIRGSGSGDIANWSFKVNKSAEQIQTISLASTVNDNQKLSGTKIVPGIGGNFQIKLDATGSEVGVGYGVQFKNETAKPVNLKYSYGGKTYNNITELNEDLQGTIAADDENKERVFDIVWNWPYQIQGTEAQISAADTLDTQNAQAIRSYSFDVVVTATQVNPNE